MIPYNYLVLEMVSNVLIDAILENISNYKGCYALDEMILVNPISSKSTSSYVINTFEKSFYHGGHWLLISYFPKTCEIEIFDSLGSPNLIPSTIIKHLQKYGTVSTPCPQIQGFLSNYCGLYCISRCISIFRGQKLSKFLSNFDQDTVSNDILVKNNLIQYIENISN